MVFFAQVCRVVLKFCFFVCLIVRIDRKVFWEMLGDGPVEMYNSHCEDLHAPHRKKLQFFHFDGVKYSLIVL